MEINYVILLIIVPSLVEVESQVARALLGLINIQKMHSKPTVHLLSVVCLGRFQFTTEERNFDFLILLILLVSSFCF